MCIRDRAEGLAEGGMLHTFEINDEQEDFTRPWLEKSPDVYKRQILPSSLCRDSDS